MSAVEAPSLSSPAVVAVPLPVVEAVAAREVAQRVLTDRQGSGAQEAVEAAPRRPEARAALWASTGYLAHRDRAGAGGMGETSWARALSQAGAAAAASLAGAAAEVAGQLPGFKVWDPVAAVAVRHTRIRPQPA